MNRTPSRMPRSSWLWTALAVVAGTGTFGLAHAQTTSAAPAMMTQVAYHGHSQGGWMLSAHALDAVGATADQKSLISAIVKQAATDLRPQHAQVESLHDQMVALMTAASVDTAAVENLRQQMLALMNTATQRRVQAQEDALVVLNATQRAQLGAQFAQRQQLMQRQRQERQALPGAA